MFHLVDVFLLISFYVQYRGCFEVHRSSSCLDLCGGIQAHPSTCASPRVLEVARKFPQKLSLSEVPRVSAWPTQFCGGGAKDDNIALYFFAKDLDRYALFSPLLDLIVVSHLLFVRYYYIFFNKSFILLTVV